jgi:hypothetical protein
MAQGLIKRAHATRIDPSQMAGDFLHRHDGFVGEGEKPKSMVNNI